MESFHTGILNQNHLWHDWDECVRGIHPYAPFVDAVYAFKSRGFGGEIELRDQQETPHKYLVC